MSEPRECARVGEVLPEYLAGRLPTEEEDRVRRHLKGCEECRERARTVGLLQQTPVPSPDPERWDRFVDGVVEATGRRRWPALVRWLWIPVAAAAAIVVLLEFGPFDRNGWGESEMEMFAREVAALPEAEARAWTLGLAAESWIVAGLEPDVPIDEPTQPGGEGDRT